MSLTWKDIHWSEGRFVVEQTKSARVRRVFIPETLQSTLRARCSRSSSLYVLPFRCESSGAFNRAVRRMSGIRDFRFHGLRHTFACDWPEEGGSKEALQIILGHSTIKLTERYGTVFDDFVGLEAERGSSEVLACGFGSQLQEATGC
jgi:integrase